MPLYPWQTFIFTVSYFKAGYSSSDPIYLAVIGIGFGIYSFYRGFKIFRLKRLIKNIPTSKIRSMAMGLVELTGRAVPLKLLKAPLTNNDCVYYEVVVQSYQKRGKSYQWVTVHRDRSFNWFYIEDDTGRVLVNPMGAEISIPKDYETISYWTSTPYKSLNFNPIKYIGTKLKFIEYHIAPQDPLYILGAAKFLSHSKDSFGEKALENYEEKIYIGRDEINKVYFISDTSEKSVLKELNWKSILGIYGGALIAIASIAYLVFQLTRKV